MLHVFIWILVKIEQRYISIGKGYIFAQAVMTKESKTKRLEFENTVIHYRVFGHGKKVMLAFHGYGQDGNSFKILADVMPEYSFYSFDLYFHGDSRIKGTRDERLLTIATWGKILELFLERERISHFELIGFSMGGKFVFATLVSFPDRIDRINLIAPDGVNNVRWYSLATGSQLMRAFFRRVVIKPKPFFSFLRISRMFGLANPRMIRFAEREMDVVSKRKRVYNTWANFRLLKVRLSRIIFMINHYNISVHFYFGKHDKVITRKHVNPLIRSLNEKKVHVLNSGHTNLIQSVADNVQKTGDL